MNRSPDPFEEDRLMTNTSRKERRRQQRKESRSGRLKQADHWTKSRKSGKFFSYAGGVVVLLAAAFGIFTWASRGQPGEFHPSQGNRHVPMGSAEMFPYNTDPPTSGSHYDPRPRWGIHKSALLKGLQAHGLEDGGVIINYRCRDCPELVRKIEAIVLRYPEYVIVAPYFDMKPLVALTAWQRIDRLEEFDEERIVRFIEAYKGIDHHAR